MHIIFNICMSCARYIFLQNCDKVQNIYVWIEGQHFVINFKITFPSCYCNLACFEASAAKS